MTWCVVASGADAVGRGRSAGDGPWASTVGGVLGVIIADVDEIEWDDVVDVVCVGPGVAALAVAVAADDSGLDVFLTDSRGRGDTETLADRLGLTDDSAMYLDWVTDDTGPLSQPAASAELTVRVAGEPPWPACGSGVSFSGAALRDWAATCLASPYGLFCTTVARADTSTVTVGTFDAGVVDIGGWLHDRARLLDITAREPTSLASLVFAAGRVVGAVIGTPADASMVRATRGVVMATGATAQIPKPAPVSFPGSATVELVLTTHPFSRFARMDLMVAERGN